ncbi:MAG: flavodoxin domain-containing protein [Methanomassiliicoccaceae archaeon]|jgi:menaquinone-dependent protoporphyrinogen oxidase|nr:flavodoxin domain-containing protein [Methanomassiliicoccaceae archaeon]
MRTVVAYVTKGGGSKECAEMLAAEIGDCVLCDLNEKTPNIDEYDTVVIGSGIRMGGAYKPFKKFLSENADALLKKNIAIFVCNVETEKYMKFVEKAVPENIRKAAFRISTFGGKPPFGGKKDTVWMLRDEVSEFAKAVREKA